MAGVKSEKEREGRTAEVYGGAGVQYELVGELAAGMLIGLQGAEPQQINSSEQIMARADIRPPPLSNTLSHLTTHKGRRRW